MMMQCYDNMLVISIPHQMKKLLPHIGGVRIVSGNSHSTPWLILAIQHVVSVPAEERNRYMTYITTYPPSVAHTLNTAWTALHTLWERIHVLRKRPQDIPTSPRPKCAVMASHTTDMHPLPHDRDCPQAILILRWRVWNSHHPTEDTYLFTFSSVRHYGKGNCRK
jgi:hypothetical protein